MDKITQLLNKTKAITYSAKKLYEEELKRGEKFNIFSVLNLSQDETRLHTPFIAELLNPKGSHGMKDAFLREFIKISDIDTELDTKEATVETEYSIGYKNNDSTEGGRIDIFVYDNKKNAIIIENKIYAGDQKNQLLRYYNYAFKNKFKFNIIYLTLYGDAASEDSVGNKKFDYDCLSYNNDILSWLERCVQISACIPLVREIIRQYIINIKDLLNIMDTDNLNELIELTTSKDYVESTLDIIDNGDSIKTQIRKNFIESLKEVAERNNLQIEPYESYDDLCCLREYSYLGFYNKKLSENWAIFIGLEKNNKNNGVFYGISQIVPDTPHVTKKLLSQIEPFWEDKEQTSEYPLGRADLMDENGQGNWKDWNNSETLRDMVNGKLAKYIDNEVIKPVLKNRLLQRIERLTKK